MSSLHFRRPSRSWLDRLPLGSGRLGAMVGAEASTRRIGLNESSAWSGGVASAQRDLVAPETAAAALARARRLILDGDPVTAEQALTPLQHGYAQAFLPVGELVVRAPRSGDAGVQRQLQFGDALHRTSMPGGQALTFASAAREAIVHIEEHDEPGETEITLTTPLRRVEERWAPDGSEIVLRLPADVAPAHEPAAAPVTWEAAGVTPVTLALAVAVRHDGAAEALPHGILIRGARRVEVVLAIESTFAGAGRDPGPLDDARRRARGAVTGLPADLVDEHRRRVAGTRFSLDLGPGRTDRDSDERVSDAASDGRPVVCTDPGLVALLVEYGAYLLRAGSRAGGLPANLQGIWNDRMQPPWSSAYTLNINTPMNYWGAEATGASEAHLALLELLEGLARRGADTARRLYGAGGWVAHHNTDAWAYSLPTAGDASWSHWVLGGGWLVRQFDEHRRHGAMSPVTRARFWPIARECARFLLDWLVEIDGLPHTVPSTSPENRFHHGAEVASATVSSAMDRALIRDVLALVVDLAADDGAVDDDVVVRARAVLPFIAGPRVQADGRIAEWGEHREDEDRAHRHLSHLYAWFPGDGADAALDAAAARTLDSRGDDSTGWSLAWKIALRARLGDGAGVQRLLDLVVRPAAEDDPHRGGLYPNLFAAHPPFQIDGNLGLVGAVLEALVQSHRPGVIDLLPALPPGLRAGRLRQLIARPGIAVDLEWADAAPVRIRLRALAPAAAGPLRLRHGRDDLDVEVPADRALEIEWPHPAPSPDILDRSTT